MLNIRCSWDHFIFNIGTPIHRKTVFILKQVPVVSYSYTHPGMSATFLRNATLLFPWTFLSVAEWFFVSHGVAFLLLQRGIPENCFRLLHLLQVFICLNSISLLNGWHWRYCSVVLSHWYKITPVDNVIASANCSLDLCVKTSTIS